MKNNNSSRHSLVLITLLILGGCSTLHDEESGIDQSRAENFVSPEGIESINPLDSLVLDEEEPALQPVEKAEPDPSPIIETAMISDPIPTDRYAPDLWVRLRASFSLEYSRPNDPVIAQFEKWYASHPKYFERLAERAYWYMPYILEQVEARGMPAEIALLPAIESAFRPEAVSRSNAVGMWQFISATGKRFGLRKDWWMDGRQDMVHSTRAALDYLEFLSEEFDNDWELVFAAYNAGEGKIRKELKRNQAANKPKKYPYLKLRKETREYVPKLFAVRNIIMDPDQFGIALNPIPNQHTLAIVDARTQTDLYVAASLIPMTERDLKKLNLGYKRGVTPPSGPHNIVVPVEYSKSLSQGLDNLDPQKKLRWARHEVRKGEYLGRIARKHGVTVESIMRANQLVSNLIKPGQELKIPISSGYHQYARASVSDVEIKDGDSLYTVKKGDSLWKISKINKITLNDLLKWNKISKKTVLQPGQKLVVGRSS